MTQHSPFFETPPGEDRLTKAAELLAHSHLQHGHALNEIDRLRAINAELLAALIVVRQSFPYDDLTDETKALINDAIAKTKGE